MKYLYYFLAFFAVGFFIGAIHATKDNSEPKETSEIINGISKNLNLEIGDTTSWISYKCNGEKQSHVSFETLKVQTDPHFQFKDKKSNLPFFAFDRIYTTVGGSLLLGWTFKDIFKSGAKAKDKLTVFLSLIGSITGYSLGYYLFKSTDIDCSSKDVEKIFLSKPNLVALKKVAITLILLSDVFVTDSCGILKCKYISHGLNDRLIDFSKLSTETGLSHKFVNKFEKYKMSFDKLRDGRIDSFCTKDIKNVQEFTDFLELLILKKELLSKEYYDIEIKNISELTNEELKALNAR